MKNILFYKFTPVSDLDTMQKELLAKCKRHKTLGKILIAEEGLNGCISGTEESIAIIKEYLEQVFGKIEFKEGSTSDHTFKKMYVRIKKEIITFKQDIDLKNSAPYIEPKELKAALDNGEEIIMLDARNIYESKIGKFKDAIVPNVLLFSQLPKVLKKNDDIKNKRIVTYCTGGIRCEKSSAWMLENGFTNVQQLHGGIIRYGEECGNAHWEGKCFVFDRRGAIDIDPANQSEPITHCELCHIPCGDYHNCALSSCDKYFICCEECLGILESCCSKRCRGQVRVHPKLKAVTFLDEKRPVQKKV